ncbi:MAG: PQQ-dependent sugar dehydrogenase [Deltaproteobacteria bacterium]|nr:PQQ-dependent sugar dehydrogenase [Deltaproteobacteria bacterium]
MKRHTKFVVSMLASATAMAVAVVSCSSSSSNKGGNGGDSGGSGGEDVSGGKGGDSGAGGSSNNTAGGSGGNVNGGNGGNGGGSAGGSGGTLSVVNTASCVPPKLKLTSVATASDSVMAIAQAEGDPRIFVVELSGIIRILRDGKLEPTPFADFTDSVMIAGNDGTSERGLLNLALHPQFKTNGRFFVFYTRRAADPLSSGAAGDIVIAEGKQSTTPDKAETTLKVFTTVTHPEDNHIGGMLGFGPDGKLYAGIGDGGGGWDKFKAGQDDKQKLAKILRFDVDKPSETVPGNLKAAGADIHSWAKGVRNPFRGSFDRATGDMYFGDVGEASYEEVNFVPPGQSDLNFGWGYDPTLVEGQHQKQSGMEGLHPFPYFTAVAWQPRDYLPVFEYPHDGPGWSAAAASYMRMGFSCGGGDSSACSAAVVGGFVYRGKKIPAMYGRYVFGDNPRNKINSFIVKDKKATCEADLSDDLEVKAAGTRVGGLSGFGEDAAGELYVLDLDKHIYRIEAE